MSNFMSLCEVGVVNIGTRTEQPIQTIEAFGSERVDISFLELHVSLL